MRRTVVLEQHHVTGSLQWRKKISDLDYVKDKFAAKQKQINMLQNWI